MKLKSVLQFEKRHRQPDGDANAKWASETDGDNVLLDRHGKPVLDKDGNPVFVDRQLGRRPLLNNDSAKDGGEDGGLRLPPEETAPVSDDPDAGLPDVPGLEEPEDGLGRLPDEADFLNETAGLGELPGGTELPEEDQELGTLPAEADFLKENPGLGELPAEDDLPKEDPGLGELPTEEEPAPQPKDRLALLLETADDE